VTEADWRLFTTLIRFDTVYVGHFKCNIRRIQDYRFLRDHLSRLYRMPGVAETVFFDHIRTHYYWSHININPYRIIPAGPVFEV
jgi:putative glutathione S-transferase